MKIDPNKDGIDHINISFAAKTKLGKMLNDFSNIPTVDVYGREWKSAYSYLCYLKTGLKDERFREMTAKEASVLYMVLVRNGQSVWVPDLLDNYWRVLRNRIERNPELREEFYANSLPYKSYTLDSNGLPMNRKIDNGVVARYNRIKTTDL